MANLRQKKTLSEVIPEIDRIIESLKTCDDYTSEQTHRYLKTIDNYSYPWKHATALANHMTKAGFGEIFPAMWKALCSDLPEVEDTSGKKQVIIVMLRVFTNLSDESPELGIVLGKCGGIQLLFDGLKKMISAHDEVAENVHLNDITTSMLQILHNAIRFSNHNRTIYRNCNAIEILKSCLRLTLSLWKLFALMILAYVANDSESGLLAIVRTEYSYLDGYCKICGQQRQPQKQYWQLHFFSV